jgi:hypothetical protein
VVRQIADGADERDPHQRESLGRVDDAAVDRAGDGLEEFRPLPPALAAVPLDAGLAPTTSTKTIRARRSSVPTDSMYARVSRREGRVRGGAHDPAPR